MIIRSLLKRHRSSPKPFDLVEWCIVNPGFANVYTHKLKSQVLPIKSLVSAVGFKDSSEPRALSSLFVPLASLNHEHKKYKLESFSELEDLVFDNTKVEELRLLLEKDTINETQATFIVRHFSNLIDIVSGYSNERYFQLICDIWQTSFRRSSGNKVAASLQTQLFNSKDKFVHILMNHGEYSFYENHVRPLYLLPAYRSLPTWADTLATTIQFTLSRKGEIQVNISSISRFLTGSSHSLKQKRLLLAIMLRKCILYSPRDHRYTYASTFFALLSSVGDDHLDLRKPEHSVYDKALRLLFTPARNTSLDMHLQNILTRVKPQSSELKANLLTTAMSSLISFSPKSVLELWKLKQSLHLPLSEDDLTLSMRALFDLKLYDAVTDLYNRHVELHHDDQISVFLKICEETKDWKGLQIKFEEMYGKGYLPYEVHYALVMNALASIGSVLEVKQLYEQLQKRQLPPSSKVFAALINAHLFSGDIESATNEFENVLEHAGELNLNSQSSSYLSTLIVKIQSKSHNLPNQMRILERCVERQKELGLELVDEEHLNVVLNLAGTLFSPKDVERIREIASDLDMSSSTILTSLMRVYTHLEQFEKAEEIAYEAHQESTVPFTNASVYKAQLRNYRQWYLSDRTRETRNFLSDRIETLIARFEGGKIRIEGADGLMSEIVKVYLMNNKLAEAENIFNRAKLAEMLSENIIVPFMKFYSKEKTYEGFSKVLDLYRQMASLKIEISTRSYVHLMEALLYLDGKSDNGLSNSFKLLESVFELNGIKLENAARSRILVEQAHDNAVNLCKMVTLYVMANQESSEESSTLLFDFVNFMRGILGENFSNQFRFTIFNLLGRLYLLQGIPELTSRLVKSGLGELQEKIKTYINDFPYSPEVLIPQALQREYRQLTGLKLRLLENNKQTDVQEYLDLYTQAAALQIKLTGQQYNELLEHITANEDQVYLFESLEMCEEHLISGNWLEAKLMRKRQFLYKVVICHYLDALGEEAVLRNFKILNAYYNVLDLKQLRQEFHDVKDPLSFLELELKEINQQVDRNSDWTVDSILSNLPEFFSPEKQITSRYKVVPHLLNRLLLAVKRHCGPDNIVAFKLMDEYPETMEYLVYHESNSLRHGVFRAMIDEVLPPRKSEDYKARCDRTYEALSHLKSLHVTYKI